MAPDQTDPDLKFTPRNDPVTFEVLRHRIWQINDEQGKTIINVSGSPVATEGNDFNVAIADASGELVAVGPYIVLHVSAITLVIQNTIALLGEDNIGEGDMYLVNDPWMGAGHQNDFCVVQPVFWDGRRIAWTASVIHQIDCGGPVPGSWNLAARSTFEEAPRYRGLRLVRGGEVQREVVATVLTNSRLPDLVDLDLRAQIAAGNVARERLHELIVRYGCGTVVDAIQDSFDYAQLMFRHKLLLLPDGSWYAEDHIDHDGHEERIYTVRCRVDKRGDRLRFDFTGTDAEAPGLINTAYAGAAAGAYCAVYPLLCQSMPWNAGVLRQIDLVVEEGTLHNARFPAPVGFGVVHACWTTQNAAALALGKMLASSDRFADDAMAGWAGSTFVYNIFGTTDRGDRFATMLLNSDLQGSGARAFDDGFDVGGKLVAPRGKVSNIESIEANYPLLYLYRRRTPDSGGAGRWRGGVSAEVAMTAHHTPEIAVTVNTVGVNHTSTLGLCGGYPGGGSQVKLQRDTDVFEVFGNGRLPHDLTDLSGELEQLPAKYVFDLRPGDVFVASPHAGGGYGDPLQRDPALVARDVENGLVSSAWAERAYGVALGPDRAALERETEALRSRLRMDRSQPAEARRPLPDGSGAPLGDRAADGPLGALLLADGWAYCSACRLSICPGGQHAKEHLLRRRDPLGRAGPCLAGRWQCDSPDFELWQYLCPHCGELLAIEQHRKGEDADWIDYAVDDPAVSDGREDR